MGFKEEFKQKYKDLKLLENFLIKEYLNLRILMLKLKITKKFEFENFGV